MRSAGQRPDRAWILGIGALAVFCVAAAHAGPVKEGQEFPDFSGRCVRTGNEVRLAELRGKVVLVDFWATWCGPCKKELPRVKEVYKKYKDQGLEVIGISLDNDLDTLKRYVDTEKLDWLHIYDGSRALSKKYGVSGIPQMYVIGRDGRVVAEGVHGGGIETAVKRAIDQKVEVEKPIDDEIERGLRAKLADADVLRGQRKYAEAIALYDEIGRAHPARPTGKLANERARVLREDPEVRKLIDEQSKENYEREADAGSADWLKVARQMRTSGNVDLARRYYQRIIDTYPNSRIAATAEEEMGKLPK